MAHDSLWAVQSHGQRQNSNYEKLSPNKTSFLPQTTQNRKPWMSVIIPGAKKFRQASTYRHAHGGTVFDSENGKEKKFQWQKFPSLGWGQSSIRGKS